MENCRCGEIPNVKKRTVQFGQGSYGYEYFIECSCGIMTRSINDYGNNYEECIKQVETIWDKWAK